MVAAASAAVAGRRATYIAPGLPAEAIGQAAAQLGARAVSLGTGTVTSDRVIPRELRQLRALLPGHAPILVEGAAADAYRGVLREIAGVVRRDPASLRSRLRAQGAKGQTP